MGQALAAFFIILFIIFTFVPLAALNDNHIEVESVKQNLNLAARSVCNAVENSLKNYENLSEGYRKSSHVGIQINKERLLQEFYDILRKNYYNEDEFERVKDRICLKVLVCGDRFYIADDRNRWSQPYFFTTYIDGVIKDVATVNILSQEVSYFCAGQQVYKPLEDPAVQMTSQKKNKIIIEKLNEIISQYTYDFQRKTSINIKIKNPDETDAGYKMQYRDFNVLDGITFFVLYAEDNYVYSDSKNFHFKNYNVTGYTFKIK
jgi:hypothetical protein